MTNSDSNGKGKIIKVDSQTVLLVEKSNHPVLGPVLLVKQLVKNGDKVDEQGMLELPLTEGTTGAMTRIISEVNDNSKTVDELLTDWTVTGSKISSNYNNSYSGDNRSHQSPYRKPRKVVAAKGGKKGFIDNAVNKPISPAVLDQKVKDTKGLTVHDIVYQFRSKETMEPPVKLPLEQLKAVIAYGMVGWNPMIARDIAGILVDAGILFYPEGDNTIRKIMHKLSEEGVVMHQSKVSGKGRMYNVWYWKNNYKELGVEFNGAGELVETGKGTSEGEKEKEVDYKIE